MVDEVQNTLDYYESIDKKVDCVTSIDESGTYVLMVLYLLIILMAL